MGITRFLTCLAICWLPVGCAAPPDNAARDYLNRSSEGTSFPRLLFAPELARIGNATPKVFEASDLASRIAALRARAAILDAPVLNRAERAQLSRQVQRIR